MTTRWAKPHEKTRLLQPQSLDYSQRLQLARYSPAGFGLVTDCDPTKELTHSRYQVVPHLAYLDRRVVMAIEAGNRRLGVMMPPRHGKSEYISHRLPAWYLGKFPDRRVMLASYEATFAESWGRKARDTFATNAPEIFGVGLDPNHSAVSDWGIAGRKGGMVTAGVGGPFTGKGGDLVIVDDPVKNAADANSPTMRQGAKDWWNSTVATRLEPGAVVIVLMTRWHEDDLLGWLLQNAKDTGETWETIVMPALAEKDEVWQIAA